jgi:hypothetical protein
MEGSEESAQEDVLLPVRKHEQDLLEKVGSSVSMAEEVIAEMSMTNYPGNNVLTELSMAFPDATTGEPARQGSEESTNRGHALRRALVYFQSLETHF